MPTPEEEIVVAPPQARIRFSLAPARNALHSLMLLLRVEKLSGLSEWVNQTAAAMTAAERKRHRLVIEGFFYAVQPERDWPSFPAYLDHLESLPPISLREKLLEAYAEMPCREAEEQPFEHETVLASKEKYLAFIYSRFEPEHVDPVLESEAYGYVVDPAAMQGLIVSHLRKMWDKYLAAEWRRVEPMLGDSVRAFEQVDFQNMSRLEAAHFVTGQGSDEEHWDKVFGFTERVIFIPSAHVGPYLGKLWAGNTAIVIFGARLPEGTQIEAPDLSRAEILVRLGALADDTRLQVLRLVAEGGEQRSQDIMSRLDLSQSAVSRHLTQLSATGFLKQRRCNGAKCYRLDPERLENTLRAVSGYVNGL